jgi:hypothetical protein
MTDFDISAAVRNILDETDLTDPGDIAAKVAEQIPARQLREVVAYLLRSHVRVEFHRYPPPPTTTKPSPANRSAKVTAIREAAPGWLRRRVHVGDSEYMVLADCTYDNLLYLQQERMTKATQLAAAADWYGRAAELVKQHHARCLGALPATALAALGEVQAA